MSEPEYSATREVGAKTAQLMLDSFSQVLEGKKRTHGPEIIAAISSLQAMEDEQGLAIMAAMISGVSHVVVAYLGQALFEVGQSVGGVTHVRWEQLEDQVWAEVQRVLP